MITMRNHVLLYCFLGCGTTTIHVQHHDSSGTIYYCTACNNATFA